MPDWWKRKKKSRRRARASGCLIGLLLAAACAGGPERAVLDQFFSASRLRDLTALEKVSNSVIFEPRQDGSVLDYDIDAIRQTGLDAEEVLVTANVRMPSGDTVRKPLLITLKRVKDQWMVAAVRVSTESGSLSFRRS